jgi:hypothetical protein
MIFLVLVALASDPVVSGVDPAVYLKARKPEPHAMRELKRLPVEMSVQILEARTLDAFLATEYPKGVNVAELRAKEERALIEGALASVAERKHQRAQEFVAKHLANPDPYIRAAAAQRSTDLAKLMVIAERDADDGVRAAALIGIASLRNKDALNALKPHAKSLAGKQALEHFASTWVSQPAAPELQAEARALVINY